MDQPTEEITTISFEVKRSIDTPGTYFIEGNQETIKMFLDLMESHLVDGKYIQQHDSVFRN